MFRQQLLKHTPFAARVATGLVVTAVEEAKRLPTTAVTLPMTAISQALQTAMRVQQGVAELAIKGDAALEQLLGDSPEQPDWAQFDELPADETDGDTLSSSSAPGRFALYSNAPEDDTSAPKSSPPAQDNPAGSDHSGPEVAPTIVNRLDYDTLTLAQLRAKLRSVSNADLAELAAYERAGRARAAFLTMIDNRLMTAQAKRSGNAVGADTAE